MIDNLGALVGYLGALTGLVTSVFFVRRAKKAEVKIKEFEVSSKEIATADEMIELVKKANAEAIRINQQIAETSKKENERLRRSITRLEKAVNAIASCPYREECPVSDKLRHDQSSVCGLSE